MILWSYMDLIPFIRELKLHDYKIIIQLVITSKNHFLRVFWSLWGCVRSFKKYIQPIFSIDESHLLVKYPCVLLIAIKNYSANKLFLFTVKEIFLEAHYAYCMVYLSKNLISDVSDRAEVKLFWATARAINMYKLNEFMQRIKLLS